MTESLLWLGIFLVGLFVFGSAAYASFSAAPWLPLRNKDHARVLKHLKGRTGTMLELGAGDARLLVDVARHTELRGKGFEISFIPFVAGKFRIWRAGVTEKSKLEFRDFFKEDFSRAHVVYCFLTPPAMLKLKSKFEKEMKPGSRIISYSFRIPDWTPTIEDRENGQIPIFIYDI